MQSEIFLAVVQAATEFLPISSSGHLALLGNLLGEPDLFLITVLHIASLLAVLVFLRKEIFELLDVKKTYRVWVYLIVATIPAVLFGYFFKSFIEASLGSYLFIGIFYFFTGSVLLMTYRGFPRNEMSWRSALVIGLFQVAALFPGVSRSGMTISSALFLGIEREKAMWFSFLLFIPLAIGAMVLETGSAYFSVSLLIGFIVCFFLSLFFINFLYYVIKKDYFWVFGIYCFVLGLFSLFQYL